MTRILDNLQFIIGFPITEETTLIIFDEIQEAPNVLNTMDIKNNCWSEDMIRATDIDGTLLPDIHHSTDIIGYITRDAASLTGLIKETPVVACAGDEGEQP